MLMFSTYNPEEIYIYIYTFLVERIASLKNILTEGMCNMAFHRSQEILQCSMACRHKGNFTYSEKQFCVR